MICAHKRINNCMIELWEAETFYSFFKHKFLLEEAAYELTLTNCNPGDSFSSRFFRTDIAHLVLLMVFEICNLNNR